MLQRGCCSGHAILRPLFRVKGPRGQRGNMIVLVLAILMGILMILLAFSLSYVRMLGSNAEQKTAIEAAALAAARDLGRVVIEDPNFGFVSISDAAPSTPNTKADDGFSMPVVSINTLLGTIRLDMIIASQLGDMTMTTLAETDYTNAMAAKDFLVASLQQAVLPGGGGADLRDVDGNAVSPYQAAVEAYQQNVVRIAGGKSRMVNGSMKLTLGCLSNPAMTATRIPNPAGLASVAGSQQVQGCYASYVDCPYNGRSFVFAGIGKDIKLVDLNAFTTSSPNGVPYAIPTIVKAEADHMIVSAGAGGSNIVHAVACAQPASVTDPRPAPGALTLSFPTGKVQDLLNPASLIGSPKLTGETLTIKTSMGGDSPGGGTLTPTTLPPYGGSMPAPQGMSTGMYDWMRRAGTKCNVSAIKNFMNTSFAGGITDTVGGINVYTWNDDGTIRYVQLTGINSRSVVVSNLQGRAELSGTFTSNGNSYDLKAVDECRQPGRMRGGLHGGEPLADAIVAAAASQPGTTIAGNFDDFGANIAGLVSLLLIVMVPSGLFVAGTQRDSKKLRQVAVFLFLSGSCTSAVGLLTACGGGGAPPPVVVTTTHTGARIPRPTYLSNGIVVDVTVAKK